MIAKLPLEGTNVLSQPFYSHIALHRVASYADEAVVRLILKKGTNVAAKGLGRQTA